MTAAEKLVFSFGNGQCEGDPARVDLLGGKGASLATLCRAGFPVPPGFTISATSCAHVQSQGQWPPGLEDQVRAALARLESATGRRFGQGPRPLLVAVRSGAPVSMPGMMDTILNCGKDQAEGEAWRALASSIDAVFASWQSERAVAYRQRHGISESIGTAVNVQSMFPSERSGVLFTANPNDPAAGEMIVEASWGLGEAVVSGAVTPDVYVLDAASLAVKRVTPGDRPGSEPALSLEQVAELARLGKRVEAHYGAACDIEWGLCENELALLQSRLIRGLDEQLDVEEGRLAEIARLETLAGGKPAVWVVHNLAETLRAPTRLTWDIVRWFMSGQGGFGRMYKTLGYRPSSRVEQAGFLDLICGRIYVDADQAAGLFWGGLPFEYDLDEVLRDPEALSRPPDKFNPERADSLFLARLPLVMWAMMRCWLKTRRLSRQVKERFENRVVARLDSFLASCQEMNLAALQTPDILVEIERRRELALGDVAAESLLPGFFAGLAHQRLTRQLSQLLGPAQGEELVARLTTGLEGDITVEQNVLLYRVAQGTANWEEFLARFGHRAAGEMELAEPRWNEDHSYLERVAQSLRREGVVSPEERHARQAEIRLSAEQELPSLLAKWGGSSLREPIERDLREAQTLLPYRELGKYHLMRGYAAMREALVELARRWELGRDLFFLEWKELAALKTHRQEHLEKIAQRKIRWKSAQKLALPDVIDSRNLAALGRPESSADGPHADSVEARPLASGVATGIARIVLDPQAATDLGSDYILVCPSTDPGWTPLFVSAKGLVVEKGGVLSHGAIVARDFGLPAVACERATTLIVDGARVQVDGNQGRIVWLDR